MSTHPLQFVLLQARQHLTTANEILSVYADPAAYEGTLKDELDYARLHLQRTIDNLNASIPYVQNLPPA